MSGRQLTREELEDRLDTLEAAVDDLNRANEQRSLELAKNRQRMTALEDANQQLRDRIAALESRVDPHPERKPYDEKTREEKVFEVRVAVARKAVANGGHGKMDYNDVLTLFGEHPSRGHAYTLMKLAADHDDEAGGSRKPGFTYGDHRGTKTLRVNLDDVKDDAVVHALNTRDDENGGAA